MFKKVDSNVDLVKLEEKILKFWDKNNIFKKTLEKNKGKERFVFYEGPPTANGAPGVHHILSRVYKDIFPRYKTMKGYDVPRKAGWDTHGLPVELEVEKELNINSKKEIEEIGIEKFNKMCRQSVMKYEEEWQKLTRRIGFWLDMDNAYLTFKNDYIETVWWILKNIWDKDLLYQDYKIVPYCPRCGTALSSHEIALGYKEVEDYSIMVKFPHGEKENTYFLVWTTTPWTLISNAAAAVKRDADYAEVEYKGEKLIMAKNLVGDVLGEDAEYNICRTFKGSEIISSGYSPIYDYAGGDKNAFKIIGGDFVSVEEGTGIVHIAPAFGEDDMNAGKENNLPLVQMVDEEGRFKKEVKKFAGLNIEKSNPEVIKELEERKLLFGVKKIKHPYPFCWRCNSRLVYYAKKSWYIKTSKIKKDLLKSNEGVRWFPEHIKYGRFGKWLEGNIDWALTRERYWGTPLPVWLDENGHKVCIGSIEELKEKAVNLPGKLDLHRPYVDDIVIKCPECGKEMRRVPEVIDVWFDSGSMPYAQFHYPFENKELFKDNFPADFICEAIDQTRGWFYTLLAISTLLFKKTSFKNVLCLGLINDENGQKMSKSRGNVINPWDILNKQGADSIRWYFFTGVSPWLTKNFSMKAIDEVIRKFILTLWNTYTFFVIYANIDNFNPYGHDLKVEERLEIDRWILSELNSTIKKVNELMDDFNVTESGRAIQNFVDVLSNWYVRRSRRRFWKSEEDRDKISAYKTLYECLVEITRLCAPFIPYLSEEIYGNLTGSIGKGKESVHLEEYPAHDENLIDKDLSFKMDIARRVVNLGRAVRSKTRIKIRQPVEKVTLYFDEDKGKKEAVNHLKGIITSELNVKKIEFAGDINELVSYDIKPNLSILGKKYGSMVPGIKKKLLSEDLVRTALKVKNGKNISLAIDGKHIELLPEEIIVEVSNKEGLGIESDGEITAGIPTVIPENLLEEGLCRELVHQVQNLRKEADFKIENTIDLAIEPGIKEDILKKFRNYIMKETLSKSMGHDFKDDMFVKEVKVNDRKIKIGIRVTGSIV
ncbi:MAG: isoleucine--tRNA ligase [Actinomycetota bacterium]|nr:isoleucine--tRNA ligase [Actinomycetota bacterium]